MTDGELLRYFEGMYSDGDADVRCYSRKVLNVRSPHKCPGKFKKLHEVPAGTRMVREKALVDGNWGTSYTCESCVIAWVEQNARRGDSNG